MCHPGKEAEICSGTKDLPGMRPGVEGVKNLKIHICF